MNSQGAGSVDNIRNSGPNMTNDGADRKDMNDNQNQQNQPNSNYNGMNQQFGNGNFDQRGNQYNQQNSYQNQRPYFQDNNFNPNDRNQGNYNRFDQNGPNDRNYRGNYNYNDGFDGRNRNYPNDNFRDDYGRRDYNDRGRPDDNYQNSRFGGNQNQYNDYGRNRPNDYNRNRYDNDYMNGPNQNYQGRRNDYDNYGPNQGYGYNQRNMNLFDQRNQNFRNDYGNQGNFGGNFGQNRDNQPPWNDNDRYNQYDQRNQNSRNYNFGNQGNFGGNQGNFGGNDYNQGNGNDMGNQNQFGQRNQRNQNDNFGNQGNFGGNQGNFGGNDYNQGNGNDMGNQNQFGQRNQNYQNDNFGNQGNFGQNQGNFGGNDYNQGNGNDTGNQNQFGQRNQNDNFGNQGNFGQNQGNFGGNQGNFGGNDNGNSYNQNYNDNSSSSNKKSSNFGGGYSSGGRSKDTTLLCEEIENSASERVDGDFQRLNMSVGLVSDQEFEDFKIRENIKIIGDCPHRLFQFNPQMMLPELFQNVRDQNWTEPTPIQKIAIPIVMSGMNLVGIAQTGSGKTAAYLIPAITYVINQNKKRGPHVLIMANTRELVKQIQEFGEILTKNTSVKVAVAYGGENNRRQQIRDIAGADIIAAAPGRLLDFIRNNNIKPESIGIVVIDEADKMVSNDFEPQCKAVISRCPKNIQTLMFSATWPDEVQFMAQNYLGEYIRVIVNSRELTININIKQMVIEKDRDSLRQLGEIVEGIKRSKGNESYPKIIIFCKTKRTVEEAHDYLAPHIKVVYTHGDVNQIDREKALNAFKHANYPIAMVCTAVLSRGIDVNDITHVVNLDMPDSITEYAHRIGRTGRMDRTGVAISLFDRRKDDRLRYELRKYMEQAGQDIPDILQ